MEERAKCRPVRRRPNRLLTAAETSRGQILGTVTFLSSCCLSHVNSGIINILSFIKDSFGVCEQEAEHQGFTATVGGDSDASACLGPGLSRL